MYLELMDHWRKVLPERFLEIDYEDTVGDFENQARRLIDYVGLEWDDACLEPHKQKRSVLTASKTQVIKPVYKTSVKSWKRYEEQLGPLIKGLGIADKDNKASKSKKTPSKTKKAKAKTSTKAGNKKKTPAKKKKG
jgi:hypothetical protein